MTTAISRPTTSDLRERRRSILDDLRLTDNELTHKVATGGLVGSEWTSWEEIEEIDYLLHGE